MLPIDRQRKIAELVRNRGTITVREISEALGVSLVTARKDIDVLHSKGLLTRIHGGAIARDVGTSFEPYYYEKRNQNREAKVGIGRAAAERVSNGETIIMDSGTTSIEMVPTLKSKVGLTVITYDLMIALELSTNSEINVIMVAGTVRNNLYSLWGPMTLEMIKRLHVNKTFLTADAVDIDYGVSNATVEGSVIKQALIEAADEVILLADHSKFGKRALAHVCGFDSIDHVITDNNLSPTVIKRLKESKVPFTLVDLPGDYQRTED